MKKPRKDILNDDEVGCVTCARYKDRFFCERCRRWSLWRGVEQVNEDLIKHGFTPYENAAEMRYEIEYGYAAMIRRRHLKKPQRH